MAADSVAVANPVKIEPKTPKMSNIGGIKDFAHIIKIFEVGTFLLSSLDIGGPCSGFFTHLIMV
jgi:hypothetical protein